MKKLLILILLVKTTSSYCQNSFSPGYIINLNRDTINGFILVDKPINNYKYCTFKIKQDSEPVTYKANEIFEYRYLGGKYFVSKDISEDSLTRTKLFLQLLIKGKINIYSFLNEKSKTFYFAEKEDDKLIELKNSDIELFDENSVKYTTKKKEYIGTLIYLMQDSREMIPLIHKSELNEKSLINLVKKYTEKVCKNEDGISFEKQSTKTLYTIYLVAGQNWINSDLSKISIFKYNEFSEKNSLLLGLDFCILDLGNTSNKISSQFGLYLNNYKLLVNGYSKPPVSFTFIQFPILINYSFLNRKNKIEPFCSAGLFFSLKLNSKSNYQFLSLPDPFCMGPTLGLGCKYNMSQKYSLQIYSSYVFLYKFLYNWQKHFDNLFSLQLKLGHSF